MTPASRLLLGVLLVVAVTIRAGFALQVPAEDPFYPDGADYSRVATGLANGQGFYPPEMRPHVVYRAPFYPVFLAGIYRVAGNENFVVVRLAQCLLAGMTGWLLFWSGRRLGGTLAGLVALGIFTVHPFFVYQCATVSPETLFIFLAVLGYSLLFRLFFEGHLRDAALAGIAFGLAAVTKGTVLPVLPAACLTLVFALRWALPKRLTAAVVLSAVTLLVISPLSIYTYARWHEFSLILDGSGLNFYIANSDDSVRLFQAQDAKEFRAVQKQLWMETLPGFEREIGNLAPASRDAWYFRRGWERFEAHPGLSLWMMWKRFKIFWGPWVHPKAYGMKEVLVSGLASVPLFIFGLWTVFRRLRQGRPDAVFGAMVMVLITLIAGMLFNTEIRWRIPLIDTLLILNTAVGVAPYLVRWPVIRHAVPASSDALPG